MIDAATLSPPTSPRAFSGPPEERAAFVRACAEAGEAEAQAVFGQMLLDGNGVAQDAPAALGWFVVAAAQQHLLALNMVGRCYDLGWGTVADKRRAAECYRIAAERGLDWGMYNYATLLALGEGVAEDRAAALAWFRKVAATGSNLAAAKAVNFVGSFHEDGWVVPRDLAAAALCYARAAQGGDFRGCFNHARMLGAAGRIEDAICWLKRVGATATPAFVDKAAAWLAASDVPAFRRRGVQALRERGMLTIVPDLLLAAHVAELRAAIDAAEWIDGVATAGGQSALAKRNAQLPEGAEAARRGGQVVLDALAGSPLFVAAALPLKVYPPLFNRYAQGEAFGAHVDGAVRIAQGSDFRVRSDVSATLFLSDPADYDGGELVIVTQFGEQRVKLPAGQLVLYPASSLHHVTPVTRGERVASVFWVQSMVRAAEHRALLFDLDQAIQSVGARLGPGDDEVVRLTGVYHNLLRHWADL